MSLTNANWPEERVETPAELHDLICVLTSDGCSTAWRGAGRAEWTIRSTLDRCLLRVAGGEDYMAWVGRERAILAEFQKRALAFASQIEAAFLKSGDGLDVWNVMALGRHAGLPTRMVDWTWSPWVAAYFACMEHSDADGCIWWFNQTQLERVLHANWDNWGVPTRGDLHGLDRPTAERLGLHERALAHTAFEAHGHSWLTKIHHPIMFPRMEAQQAFMTVCGRVRMDHNDAMDELPNSESVQRGRIRVAAAAKAGIMERLKSYNVDARSLLYPGIDIVARIIARRFDGGA